MIRTFVGMVFAAAMVIAGCGGKRSTTDDGPSVVPRTSKDTTKLADAEVVAVLARTKPLVADPAGTQAFTISRARIDCGGVCPVCATARACAAARDCASSACDNGVVSLGTCS